MTTPSFDVILAPIALPDQAPAVCDEASRRFQDWLAVHGGDELRRWNETISRTAVRRGHRNALSAASCVPFSSAHSAARIRGQFLGMSPILETAEELWQASWAPTKAGGCQVWASHLDQRELWPVCYSIADFVLEQYRNDPHFRNIKSERRVTIPPELAGVSAAGPSPLPEGLSIESLTPRTDWIVAMFSLEGDWHGMGDGLEGVPAFSVFVEEEERVRRWPHLQAYWLLHHLVFDNREALVQLLPLVERCYAPSAELAGWAEAALSGREIPSPLWKPKTIEGFRATAEQKRPDVFAAAALERRRAAGGERRALLAEAGAALDALADQDGVKMWRVLNQNAGPYLDAAEQDYIRRNYKGASEQDNAVMLVKRGARPVIGPVLYNLAQLADARWLPLARASLRLNAPLPEEHEDWAPGALAILGAALGDWRAFAAETAAVLGPIERLSPLARLSAAAAALKLAPKDAEARAFLRKEAERFLAQLDSSHTDTGDLAVRDLLVQGDSQIFDALAKAMRGRVKFYAGHSLLALLRSDRIKDGRIAAPVFEAALEARFGLPADGDHVVIAGALGKAAPERAKQFFMMRSPVTKEDEAAWAAGLLAAAPTDEAAKARALAALEGLDISRERECGAGLALLRLADELAVEGFSESARRWMESGERSRHAGEDLRKWFEANADKIR
jgi:hypothetical protein